MCGHGCAVGLVQRLASHMEEQVEVSSMSLFAKIQIAPPPPISVVIINVFHAR